MSSPRGRVALPAPEVRRRAVLALLFVLGFAVLVFRAAQIQLWLDDRLGGFADEQVTGKVKLRATRGAILDRRGAPLAVNVPRYSFFAYPGRERATVELASLFASVCGESPRSLAARWGKTEGAYTFLLRQCEPSVARELLSREMSGVYVTPEPARAYPRIGTAWSPLGFVDVDGVGRSGLEQRYESALSGVSGEGACLRDAKGRLYAADPIAIRRPVAGSDLRTTLDAEWQSILDEELQLGVERYGALWGVAVLIDPSTGAVLAMADCQKIGGTDLRERSRLVSQIFEPGSTLKLVTWAAAFAEGVLDEGDLFWAGHGRERFSNRIIEDDHPHDTLTAAEAFIVSSNIVAGKIGLRLGGDRLSSWMRRFGFGRRTEIDLPAETSGRIARQVWSDANTATLSFGHGLACTAIQLAMAYGAVANGGLLLKPYIVESETVPDGTTRTVGEPTVVGRLFDPVVAHKMRRLMARVVTEGTAKPIADSTLPIAGKTGTAETVDVEAKRVRKDQFAACFVGFHPVEVPRVVGAVILMRPEPIHYGGWTAGPVFKRVVERGRALLEGNGRSRPSMPRHHDGPAGALLAGLGPSGVGTAQPEPEPSIVDAPSPGGVATWDGVSEDYWVAGSDDHGRQDAEPAVVPDVVGLSLRQAMNELYRQGIECTASGSGLVVKQSPSAGTVLKSGNTCRLRLR